MRICAWCRRPLDTDPRRVWCSKACRQAAFRLRELGKLEGSDGAPRRCAYADPPYPGLARRYYRDRAEFRGEVDHVELLSRLEHFDGWALSTSEKSLRDVLALCPPGVRVAAWSKPLVASRRTRGIHNTWEPVIVKPARRLRPGVPSWLLAAPAHGGGDLPGRKPIRFCHWLFQLIGMVPGDDFADLFPGTGIVGASWRELSSGCSRDTSPRSSGDASPLPARDVSLRARGDASPSPACDASLATSVDASLPAGNDEKGGYPASHHPSENARAGRLRAGFAAESADRAPEAEL